MTLLPSNVGSAKRISAPSVRPRGGRLVPSAALLGRDGSVARAAWGSQRDRPAGRWAGGLGVVAEQEPGAFIKLMGDRW
jgi:hypothetical protein